MTEKQHLANIANAQKSSGPRSPEGKRRSSLNSTRHSLTGQIQIATPEELAAFHKHCDDIRAELKPEGAIETYYATAVCENMWRAARARAIENGLFANGHLTHAESVDAGHPEVDTALAQSTTWNERSDKLATLTLYEQRIARAIEKNMATLQALQQARKEAYKKAQDDAVQFAYHAQCNNVTYEPGGDFLPASNYGGFVYSLPQLETLVDRDTRLRRAFVTYARDRFPRSFPPPKNESNDWSQ